MPKFKVVDTFTLPSKLWFVLAGSIVEGSIEAGMMVYIPFNSSFGTSLPIHSIEFARQEGREDCCLVVQCQEDDELDLLMFLNVKDDVLDVVHPKNT